MKYKKLFVGVATATAALALGAGVAVAVWTSTGSGSGAGAATVAVSLTVTPITPAGANATLYPGGPSGLVMVTIKNPNPYSIKITGLAWGAPTSTNTSTCASANISLAAGAPTSTTIVIAGNSTDANQVINSVLSLSHTAGNGCQGVAFDIPLTVTGTEQ